MAETDAASGLLQDWLADVFERAGASLPTLSGEEIGEMARVASSRSVRAKPGRFRFSARQMGIVVAAALAMGFAAPLLAGINPLHEIAQLTGIREEPPPRPVAGYKPADVPYVSVLPLMQYLGSSQPVVPAAAVTTRDGKQVVFVASRPDYQGQYTQLHVDARPVTVGRKVGKAVVIASGLTPCARIVVAPPASLQSGDSIRSYAEQVTDNGPTIDYKLLFGGRAPAPTSPLGGGIAWQQGNTVGVGINYTGPQPPAGAYYLYRAPDGTLQKLPYKPITNARIPVGVLKQGEPVGSVELRTPRGDVLAQATLEYYCTS